MDISGTEGSDETVFPISHDDMAETGGVAGRHRACARNGLAQSAAEVRHGLKDVPLRDLCHLGGWRSHDTILTCYQHSEEHRMREALRAHGQPTHDGGPLDKKPATVRITDGTPQNRI